MFEVKKLVPHAIVPTRAEPGSAGLDLSASEDIIIQAHKWEAVSTGISLSVPRDCYVRIAPRSGLALKKGIDVGAGVVDSSYRGEIKAILYNHGNTDFEIKRGDRIAQIIFEKIFTNDLVEVDELTFTQRGIGGFGSTGI